MMDMSFFMFISVLMGTLLHFAIMAFDDWPMPQPWKKVEPAKPAVVSVFNDPSFFMPHVKCPSCNMEALHWMQAPDFAAAQDTIRRHEMRDELAAIRRRRAGKCSPCSEREPQIPAAVRKARKLLADRPDVIRTCRGCGHEWPQKIGLPTEVAA